MITTAKLKPIELLSSIIQTTIDIAQKCVILYRRKLRCYILHLTELLLGVRCSRYHVIGTSERQWMQKQRR